MKIACENKLSSNWAKKKMKHYLYNEELQKSKNKKNTFSFETKYLEANKINKSQC